MLKRTIFFRDLHTTTTNSPSFRAMPMRNMLATVAQSPYKDSFKEYWSTPVPWQPREYGPKPKIGDPVPLREAATMLVVGKNNHIHPDKVKSGEDNDYKVLMLFREPQGRYHKDQFVLPAAPITLPDKDEEWGPLLWRLGVRTPHSDMVHRIAALRALLVEANMMVIPPKDGGLAEVQGPPGTRKWHLMIMSQPSMMRQFLDIVELPMEETLKTMMPFLRIQTPNTEQFRFDSTSYIVPFPKIPCVKYTISTFNEQLFWVSPKEALARYEAGVMELPTPTIVLFNELDKHFPRYEDIGKKLTMDTEPRTICPELVHDPETRMATVLLPGDIHHSETPKLRAEALVKRKAQREKQKLKTLNMDPAAASASSSSSSKKSATSSNENNSNNNNNKKTTAEIVEEEDKELPQLFYRIHYEKDEPYGVKSSLCNRVINPEVDNMEELPRMEEKLIEEDAPQLLTPEKMKEEHETYLAARQAQTAGKNTKTMEMETQASKSATSKSASSGIPKMPVQEEGEFISETFKRPPPPT